MTKLPSNLSLYDFGGPTAFPQYGAVELPAFGGRFEYLPGEINAWSAFLRSGADHAALFTCRRGHVLESPIDLTQEQIDARCIRCAERHNGN